MAEFWSVKHEDDVHPPAHLGWKNVIPHFSSQLLPPKTAIRDDKGLGPQLVDDLNQEKVINDETDNHQWWD